jgi:hypothetical protein
LTTTSTRIVASDQEERRPASATSSENTGLP